MDGAAEGCRGDQPLLHGFHLPIPVDEDVLEHREKFTAAVDRNLSLPLVSVVLMTEGKTIVAVGRIWRGGPITTFERRVSIDMIEWCDSLSFEEITREVGVRFHGHLHRVLSGRGRIPPRTWHAVKKAIAHLRSEIDSHIEYIESVTQIRAGRLQNEDLDVPMLEKEAVGLSLSIVGIGREPLAAWSAPEQPAPFLAGLKAAGLLEDQVIQHDLRVFGDWSILMTFAVGAVVFSDGERRLTVLNANRSPVEQTLGVDLIYYNHDCNSYVLVQYKRFRAEERPGNQKGSKRVWVYRPSSDSNLEPEHGHCI